MSEPFKLYEEARREMYAAMEAASGPGGDAAAKAGFTLALRGFDKFLAEAARGRGMYRELEKKATKMRINCISRGGVSEPAPAPPSPHRSSSPPSTGRRRSPGTPDAVGQVGKHHHRDRRQTAIVPKPHVPARPAPVRSPAAPGSEARGRRRFTVDSSSSDDDDDYTRSHRLRSTHAASTRRSHAAALVSSRGTPTGRTPRRVDSDGEDEDDNRLHHAVARHGLQTEDRPGTLASTTPRHHIHRPRGHEFALSPPRTRASPIRTPLSYSPGASGRMGISAGELVVRRGASGDNGVHPTIASAVAAAKPGQVVSIEAGVYTEELKLSRPVTLKAATDGVTIRSTCGRTLITSSSNDVHVVGIRLDHTGGDPSKKGRSSVRAVECHMGSLQLTGCKASSQIGSGVSVADGGFLTLVDCDLVGCGKCGAIVFEGGKLACRGSNIADNSLYGVVVQHGGETVSEGNRISGNKHAGVLVHGSGSRCRLKDSDVSGNGEMGVGVQKGAAAMLEGINVSHNLHAGMFIDGVGSTLEVVGGEVMGNGVRGVGVQSGASLSMLRCSVSGNVQEGVFVSGIGSKAEITGMNTISLNGTKGVGCQSGAAVLLAGSVVELNGEEGVFVSDAGSQIKIKGCTVRGNGVKGVGVQSGAQAEVVGSLVSRNGREGVYVSGEGSRCLVQDNDVTDNGVKAVGVQDLAEVAVEGNRLLNNRHVGIHVYRPGARAIVRDNDISGHSLGPALTEGGGTLNSVSNRVDGVKEADLPGGRGLEGEAGVDRVTLPAPPAAMTGRNSVEAAADLEGKNQQTQAAGVFGAAGAGQGVRGSPGIAPPVEWAASPVVALPPSNAASAAASPHLGGGVALLSPAASGPRPSAWAVELSVISCRGLPNIGGGSIDAPDAFVCASIFTQEVALTQGEGMVVDHNVKSTHTLTRTLGKGRLFKVPPQARTGSGIMCPSRDPDYDGQSFLLTTATSGLDAAEKSAPLTGSPVNILITVHDKDGSWIGRTVAPLAPNSTQVSSSSKASLPPRALRLPLLSSSGEPLPPALPAKNGEGACVHVLVSYRRKDATLRSPAPGGVGASSARSIDGEAHQQTLQNRMSMSPPSTALSAADLRSATPAHSPKKPEKPTPRSPGQGVMYLDDHARMAPSTVPAPSASKKPANLAHWPHGFEMRRRSSEFVGEPPSPTDSPKQPPSQNSTGNNSQPRNSNSARIHNRLRENPPPGGGAADVEKQVVAHASEGLSRASIKAGDILRVIDDRAEVERLTKSAPGIAWNDAMGDCCGRQGEVVAVLDTFAGMRFDARLSWCFVYGALQRIPNA